MSRQLLFSKIEVSLFFFSATFFYQNGVAGACGTVHSDSEFIAAIGKSAHVNVITFFIDNFLTDERRYGNSGARSSLCGKQVQITNTKNGKSVKVTIADDCPTCTNSNSIDLSVGAFNAIATEAEGMVPSAYPRLHPRHLHVC